MSKFQKLLKVASVFALAARPIEAVLTKDATVYLDSVWPICGPGYCNCPNGVVDGKLYPMGLGPGSSSHCCSTTNTPNVGANLPASINIDMGSFYVVQTVLIVNREEFSFAANRIVGTDLHVQGVRCNQNPTRSGVYYCGGLIGQWLGLWGNYGQYSNICQIRAYSYEDVLKAQIAHTFNRFTCIANCMYSNLEWPGSKILWENTTISTVGNGAGNLAYYEIRFHQVRFIHVVTVIGEWSNGFYTNSKNWFLTVGNLTGTDVVKNPVFGSHIDDLFDSAGKEMIVGAFGQSVALYAYDTLQLRTILVFSTASNCSGVLDWSGSKQDWPTRIPLQTTSQVVSGLSFATLHDDCAVIHQATVVGPFAYNIYTHMATLTIGTLLSEVGIHSITVTATQQDKVTTPRSESKTITIEVFCATSLTFSNLTPLVLFTNQAGTQEDFNLPALILAPADAVTNYVVTTLGAPSFVTSTPTILSVGANATSGKYAFQVQVMDTISTLMTSLAVTLYAVDPCKYSVITSNPATLQNMQLYIFESSVETQSLTITYDILNYSYPCTLVASLSPPAAYIQISPDFKTISVDSSLVALPSDIGIHAFTLTISTNEYGPSGPVLPLNLNVEIICRISDLSILTKPSDLTYKLNQGLISMSFNFNQKFACMLPYTFAHKVTKDGVIIANPAWLSFDQFTWNYYMTVTSPSDVGVYVIQLTGSIPFTNPSTGQNWLASESFNLTILHDCVDTLFISRQLRYMKARLAVFDDTQSLWIEDTIARGHSNSTYCYARSYSILSKSPFAIIRGDELVITTNNPVDEGLHIVLIQVTLQSFPNVPAFQTSINVTIECEIVKIVQVASIPGLISHRILVDPQATYDFLFAPYPACKLQYSLAPKEVPFTAKMNAAINKIDFESHSLGDRGLYQFNLTAAPLPPTFGVSKTQVFTVHLIDMCQQAWFEDQAISNIEVVRQSPQFSEPHTLKYSEWQYFPKTKLKLDCGQVTLGLFLSGTTKKSPPWIRAGPDGVKINFQQAEKPQKVELDLVVSLEQYPAIHLVKNFTVTLGDSDLSCIPTPKKSYKLGDPQFNFGITFKNNTFVKMTKLTPYIEPIAFDWANIEIPMPRFISYDKELNNFSIESENFEDLGTFKVGLKMGYNELPESATTCLKTLSIEYEPSFEGEEIENQGILVGKKWSLTLPKYIDCFGKQAKMELILGDAANFVKYDPETNSLTLKIDPFELVGFLGSYEINLTFSDQKGSKKKVSFNAKVVQLISDFSEEDKIPKHVPPPRPFISKVSNFGEVRVSFTMPIVLPTFGLYPEFLMEPFMNQNCTNGGICDQERKLETEQEVAEAIQIANRGLVWVADVKMPIVELSIIPGEISDEGKLGMIWNCTNFTSTFMDFQITYEHAEQVSINEYMEKIKIAYHGLKYFASEDGQIFNNEDAIIKKTVPQQMKASTAGTMKGLADAISKTSKAVMIANFVQNLLFGGSLSSLFGAIGKLQIMVHLLITDVKIPANAQVYFSGLLQLVTYQVIDPESFLRKTFKLQDEEEFNPNFFALGYHSVFMVINLGTMTFIFLLQLSSLLFIAVTKRLQNKYIVKLRGKAKNSIMWNSVLTLINESYIIIALSCLMQYKFLSFKSAGKAFSSLLSFVLGAIILISPFINLAILIKNKHKLKNKDFKSKYDSLYESLNYRRYPTLGVLIEPCLSQLRILIMSIALIYFENHPYFQILINNFLVTFILIHIKWWEVFADKNERFFQAFNECFVFMLNYHMLCFADLVLDAPTLQLLGWSAIVTITLNLSINFGFIIFTNGRETYKYFKIKYYNNKRAKIEKQREQQRQEKLAQEAKQCELERQEELKAALQKEAQVEEEKDSVYVSSVDSLDALIARILEEESQSDSDCNLEAEINAYARDLEMNSSHETHKVEAVFKGPLLKPQIDLTEQEIMIDTSSLRQVNRNFQENKDDKKEMLIIEEEHYKNCISIDRKEVTEFMEESQRIKQKQENTMSTLEKIMSEQRERNPVKKPPKVVLFSENCDVQDLLARVRKRNTELKQQVPDIEYARRVFNEEP